MNLGFPRRGEIVIIDLDPVVGSEIRKTRPCLIVSNDRANEFTSRVTVVPVTEYDERKAAIPVYVPLVEGAAGLRKRSVVNCSQIRTVDQARIRGRPLGKISDSTGRSVDAALKLHLALP